MAKAALSFLCALALLTVGVVIDADGAGPSPNPLFEDAIWLAQPGSALRINSSSGSVDSLIEVDTGVRVIDVDHRSANVWIYGGGTLSKFDFDGTLLLSVAVELGAGNAEHHVDLAVDSDNALLWLAVKRELFVFDTHGALIGTYALQRDVQAIALDPKRQQVWVAGKRTITAFDAFIGPVDQIDIEHADKLVDLALDSEADFLWIVTAKDVLHRLDRSWQISELIRNAPAGSSRLAVDYHGGLWVATPQDLVHLDSTGIEQFRVPLPSKKPPVDLVASMSDGSAWVATEDAVRHVALDGTVLVTLDIPSKRQADQIRNLASYVDVIPPEITVRIPADGSFIPDNTPAVELVYSDVGIGVDTATLIVTVDGRLEHAFCTFDADLAFCEIAEPLDEGAHELVASISDFAGNRSLPSAVNFIVDTIPPPALDPSRLTIDGPLDGLVSIEAVSGASEALALVRIRNARTGEVVEVSADQGGGFETQIAAQQGDDLIFTVVDKAGNVSAETLVTVNGLVLTIDSPSEGSIVDGLFAQVTGTIEGPENIGVAVNGVVALIDGESYIADQVPLVAGENVVRVTATAPSGASASEEIRIFSSGRQPLLTLLPSIHSGIAPLKVIFRMAFFVDQKVSITLQDLDGDGQEDRGFLRRFFGAPSFVDPAPFEVSQTFTEPGIYRARIKVALQDGTELNDQVVIQVLAPEVLDARLLGVWDGVFEAVTAGDVERALKYMSSSGRQKYRRVFQALSAEMETILGDFSRPEMLSASGGVGEYAVVRLRNGRRQVFLIYFVQGSDGVWRLDTL